MAATEASHKANKLLAELTASTSEWDQQGACVGVDPDLFFPERGASMHEAKAVCATCQVQFQCLQYALAANEKYGVWGGKSRRERERIMGRRRK